MESTATEASDIEEEYMKDLITKAGGANYGTGN